jgi:hypothetical protein
MFTAVTSKKLNCTANYRRIHNRPTYYENEVHGDIWEKINSDSVSCYSLRKLLPLHLISTTLKIRINNTKSFLVAFVGVKHGLLP